MKRLSAIIVLMLLSVGLLDATGIISRIWCVGADGHISVEYVAGRDCVDAVTKSVSAVYAPALDEHCGPCTDTVVTSDQSTLRAALSVQAPLGKVVIPVPPFALVTETSDVNSVMRIDLSRLDSPRLPHGLAQRRSVVLLI